MTYLHLLGARRSPPDGGSKAARLQRLARLRLPGGQRVAVPRTVVCTTAAYRAAQNDAAGVAAALRAELAAWIAPEKRYAVRSSATLEDGADHAFAGQFASVLDVQGVDGVLAALQRVWDSAESHTVRSYLDATGQTDAALAMGVLIQEMVPPVVSGIAFSRNPLTGLDEIVVEAVAGRGDALAQDGVTPARWVHKWGDWVQQPESTTLAAEPIAAVVAQVPAIADQFGEPVDLEWVYDGRQVWWVQVRPITALRDVSIYSNRIAKEVLPGIIKPLIWSVNVPLVNGAWVRFFTEMIGRNTIDPLALARSFYYRCYFNMGVIGDIFALLGFPRESLELLMGLEGGAARPRFRPSGRTYRLLPRMLRFAAGKWRFGARVDRFLTDIDAVHASFDRAAVAALDEPRLLAEIDRLYAVTQETAYFNIVTPLLNQLYNRLLHGRLRRRGIDPVAFDVTHGMAELRAFDPNWHAAHGMDEAAFVARFGHLSESGNDFSAEPWREQPALVRTLLEQGRNRPPAAARPKMTLADVPRPGPLLRLLHARARRFTYYREAISFTYTYGYGLFRDYFLALGRRLAQRAVLARPDDIFYLTFDEVRAVVAGESADVARRVAERRAAVVAARDVVPPETIFGDQEIPLETQPGDRLSGIPTARGYYRGPVRVVERLDAFERVRPGDVIVIPFSDVGWTPLFTRAGAVIAESGGVLSHSSIVAREYHLPCVVSVAGACRRLRDGMIVTVDGFNGTVTIHDEAPTA